MLLTVVVLAVATSGCHLAAPDARLTFESGALRAFSEQEFELAEELLLSAIKEADDSGTSDANLVSDLNILGDVYLLNDKYSESEEVRLRALEVSSKISGDPTKLLDGLARTYMLQGKYAESESLVKRTLAIWEKASGAESQRAAECLELLATVTESQGKYVEAETAYVRCLTINRKVKGLEHTTVSRNLLSLGSLKRRQKKYAAARLYRESIAIDTGAQPLQPTDVTRWHLALVLEIQNKPDEAREEMRQVLIERRQRDYVGELHVAFSVKQRGDEFLKDGRYPEAEASYIAALLLFTEARGPDNAHVLQMLNSISNAVRKQDREREADVLKRWSNGYDL